MILYQEIEVTGYKRQLAGLDLVVPHAGPMGEICKLKRRFLFFRKLPFYCCNNGMQEKIFIRRVSGFPGMDHPV